MFFFVRIKRLYLSAVSVVLVSAVCIGFLIKPPEVIEQTKQVVLPVVMYHGLMRNEKRRNQYMINPEHFEEDLRYLTENGYQTIVVEDLLNYFNSGTALPPKPIMLTFDDGYYNNYTEAFPLLKKYGCKAVLSPIGIEGEKAQSDNNRSPDYSQCTWQELKEMSDSGMIELQNHTYDLHHIKEGRQGADRKSGEDNEEYRKMLQNDLQKANDIIAKKTGSKPSCFTCPFGAKNEEMLGVVKETGFSAMMDCEEKVNYLNEAEDLYAIHRFLRPDNVSSEVFFNRILSE